MRLVFASTIQSDRETWLVDVAATPRSAGAGATAGIDGGTMLTEGFVSAWGRLHVDLCRLSTSICHS
jgi:hypothetical protein